MRTRSSLWVTLAVLVTVGSAGIASATRSVALLVTSRNGVPIAPTGVLGVLPGDEIGIEMWISTGPEGVSGYAISVDYDSLGTGRLLLDDFSSTIPLGLSFKFTDPFGPADPRGTPGFVSSFNAGTLTATALTEDTSFLIGSLDLTVTSSILEGSAQVTPGLFNVGVDEILSNDLVLIGGGFEFESVSASYGFGSALLVPLPEPATQGLLVLGYICALTLGRRPGR